MVARVSDSVRRVRLEYIERASRQVSVPTPAWLYFAHCYLVDRTRSSWAHGSDVDISVDTNARCSFVLTTNLNSRYRVPDIICCYMIPTNDEIQLQSTTDCKKADAHCLQSRSIS
jgi:hypothetical protein